MCVCVVRVLWARGRDGSELSTASCRQRKPQQKKNIRNSKQRGYNNIKDKRKNNNHGSKESKERKEERERNERDRDAAEGGK